MTTRYPVRETIDIIHSEYIVYDKYTEGTFIIMSHNLCTFRHGGLPATLEIRQGLPSDTVFYHLDHILDMEDGFPRKILYKRSEWRKQPSFIVVVS